MKNGSNFINLESTFFSKFFNLPETIEFNTNEDNIEDQNNQNNQNNDNNIEENVPLHELLNTNKNKNDELVDTTSDTNSELSYELYCYSDEEP